MSPKNQTVAPYLVPRSRWHEIKMDFLSNLSDNVQLTRSLINETTDGRDYRIRALLNFLNDTICVVDQYQRF